MSPPALHPRLPARALALLVASLLALAAHAAEMYRWVDERGVTNVSDSVPDKYKHVAQRIDTSQFDAEEARRRDAMRRAAASSSSTASAPAVAPNAVALGNASPHAAETPASAADDCPALQRRYREAQKCFGPAIKTLNGTVNAARSPNCPSVVDPEPRCGPDPLQK